MKKRTRENAKSVLDALRAIANANNQEKIEFDSFSKGLGRRGYGLILLTLNLPNLIPLPLPFLSIIFGIPLALVGLQLALGIESPWLPPFLRKRGLAKEELLIFCDKIDAHYGWFHRLLRPRFLFLTRGAVVRLIGLFIFLLASVMALPIPFGNLVLAIPITIVSMGLLERDGVFILTGLVMGICGFIFNALIGSSLLVGAFLAGKAITATLFG